MTSTPVANPLEVRHRFDRPGALLHWLDENLNQLPVGERASERRGSRHSGQYRTANLDEARRLYLEGWPEGVVEMQAVRDEVERNVLEQVVQPQVRRSVSGSDIDMGAYLAGAPENMLEWEPHTQTADGVRIVVNGGMLAGVASPVVMARGAVIVSLLHALQIANVPADLYLSFCSGGSYDHRASHKVLIHASRPGEEVDIERLAFMIGHPSMFRRLIFAMRESEPDEGWRRAQGVPGGYGQTMEGCDHGLEGVSLSLPATVSGGDPRWSSLDRAVAWVLKELKRLGVELEEA